MATPLKLSTLESLLEWVAEDDKDDAILARIKNLAKTHLPQGWLEWKVVVISKEDILGTDLDPQVLNKIRFALPTVGLARAFFPTCTSLPERVYRDMKLKMLEWPLCTGLIIGPPAVASRIRGTAVHNELVISALSELKPLLLARKEASHQIAQENEDEEETFSVSARSTPSASTKSSRLGKLEEGHLELKNMLSSFMKRFEVPTDEDSECDFSENEEEAFQPPLPSSSHEVNEQNTGWAPPLLELDADEDFDFSPKTKEMEPTIPPAKPHIQGQGIDCLRLGESSFKLIRYAEVQRKLQASPVFSAFKVNPLLAHLSSSPQLQEHLIRADTTLGTILHGLLLQRDSLGQTVRDLSAKHPSLKQDLKAAFSAPESTFKSFSDDLLQYACGRRAEIIEMRRNNFLPKQDFLAPSVKAIPPSATHLFDEAQLSELTKQSSYQQFFRPSKPSFRSRQSCPPATAAFKAPKTNSRQRHFTPYKAQTSGQGRTQAKPYIRQNAATGSRDKHFRNQQSKKSRTA